MVLNYIDLFSGIGGFHRGFDEAGLKFTWTGFSEIDKHAKHIYKKHFVDSKELGDVRSIDPAGLPHAHVVTFGFPCQDLSMAGKRKGLSGERSGLFFEAMRIIEIIKPEIFIFENVKGLFSSNDGLDFEVILRAIADLGLYECEWQLLNTRWFLPQNRERIYFVGHLRGTGGPSIFPFGIETPAHSISDVPVAACIAAGYGSDRGGCYVIDHQATPGRFRSPWFKEESPPLISNRNGYALVPSESGENSLNDSHATVDLLLSERGELALTEHQGDVVTMDSAQAHPALCAGTFNTLNGIGIAHKGKIRRMTEIECERLQGFPDNWTNGISSRQRYRCIGNAVSVPVTKAIGERIKMKFEKMNLV